MNRDLESTVWRMAQLQGAGAVFRKLIEDAVSRYTRASGLTHPIDCTRLTSV